MLLNPQLIFTFPLLVAIDKGVLHAAGVNMQAVIHNGSSQLIIPELARGDVDIATISANPGFFNQFPRASTRS